MSRDEERRDYVDTNDPVAVRAGEELDVDQLRAYLLEALPGDLLPSAVPNADLVASDVPTSPLPADALPELRVRQFPGGYSNLTYLLEWGDLELVLRRPPVGNRVRGAHDMGREYRVLSALSPSYEAAPQPYLYCQDVSVLGVPFYVMQRARGVILRRDSQLDEATLRRLSEAFVDHLADLHSFDYDSAGLGDLGRPEGYAERQIEGWTERYRKAQTDEVAPLEQLIDWLHQQLPEAAPALAPEVGGAALLHNDYKYDNLVLDPEDPTRIRAVLDWEMCTVGAPLLDLGTSLAYWVEAGDGEAFVPLAFGPTHQPGSFTRRQVAERYAQRTGADLGPLLFAYAAGLFKLAVIGQQIYARYRKGLTQDARFAGLGPLVAGCGLLALSAVERGEP